MSSELQRACVALEVPVGQRDEVLSVFRWVLARAQAWPGFHRGFCCEEPDGVRRARLVTEWQARPELEKFIQSDLFAAILAATELCDSPPVMSFEKITDRRNIDCVIAVRGRASRERRADERATTSGGRDGTQP